MRLGRKKKEIDQFSEKLEQALDALATGAEISVEEEMDDSLWGKISVRFKRLQEIWSEKEAESKKDKQQMKELISDISHQTKNTDRKSESLFRTVAGRGFGRKRDGRIFKPDGAAD